MATEDESKEVDTLGNVDQEGAEILDMDDTQLQDYFTKANEPVEQEESDEGDNNESDDKDAESDSDSGETSSESDEDGEQDSDEEGSDDEEDIGEESDDEGTESDESKPTADESESDDEEDDTKSESESTEVNYKDEHERALAPLKAIGRTVKVDTIEDLRTLAQMGIGYNKRMQVLKPNLKLVKMLEQNDLLDEGKLSHLIDISKKDPNAIRKFLKDSDIDPRDIDTEDDDVDSYRPSDHSVNDSQIELDQVLDDIRENDSFPKTIDTISNKWDEQSRSIILNDPQIIPVIDGHVQTGIFDKIVTEMEREKLLGRLNGMSDIEAYKATGDKLQKAGEFDTVPESDPQEIEEKAKETKRVEKKRSDKRKAAGSTRGSSPKKKQAFDPLNMSDEEFAKISMEDLYN